MLIYHRTCYWILNRIVARLPFWTIRRFFFRHFFQMKIGSGTVIARGVSVLSPQRIVIGDHTLINSGAILDGRGGLIIGDNVDVAWHVAILTSYHDYQDCEYKAALSRCVLNDRACIATRAIILPGVEIGEGSVVAAGAVATKDVPKWTIVAGVPAKPLRTRSNHQVYKLKYPSALTL